MDNYHATNYEILCTLCFYLMWSNIIASELMNLMYVYMKIYVEMQVERSVVVELNSPLFCHNNI